MSRELFWLTLTTAMTALFWVPYILDRIMVRGPAGAMANPSPRDKPQSAWAQRMMAAHTNAIDNLVIFGILVLTLQDLNISSRGLLLGAACPFRSLHGRHPGGADFGVHRRLACASGSGAGDLPAGVTP
jgi:uncharacterized MAPEG superfamily protein